MDRPSLRLKAWLELKAQEHQSLNLLFNPDQPQLSNGGTQCGALGAKRSELFVTRFYYEFNVLECYNTKAKVGDGTSWSPANSRGEETVF